MIIIDSICISKTVVKSKCSNINEFAENIKDQKVRDILESVHGSLATVRLILCPNESCKVKVLGWEIENCYIDKDEIDGLESDKTWLITKNIKQFSQQMDLNNIIEME